MPDQIVGYAVVIWNQYPYVIVPGLMLLALPVFAACMWWEYRRDLGVRIARKAAARLAGGRVYIGVTGIAETCSVFISSDAVPGGAAKLRTGEAVCVETTQGTYRAVLIKIEPDHCTFDLVRQCC